MRRARGRVVAVVTTWLVALGVVVAGMGVPTVALADEAESSTTITLPRERWWLGEVVSLDVTVLHDGMPAEGVVRTTLDGYQVSDPTSLVDGRGHITFTSTATVTMKAGEHRLEVAHFQRGVSTPLSVASAVLRVDVPARPVVPEPRVYGDPADVKVDLTGTDLPQNGWAELDDEVGRALGAAALTGGVATVAVPGTGMTPGRVYRMVLRDAAGGTVLSTWFVGANVQKRPATLTVQTSSTWRLGWQAKVVVRAVSDLGPVTGTIEVRNHISDDWSPGRTAELVDGVATVAFDPGDVLNLSKPDPKVFVELRSSFYAAPIVPKIVNVKPRFQSWVQIETGQRTEWRYGTARRVRFLVTSETGARLDGKVTFSRGTRVLGTARIVDGKGSLLVGSTALAPGRHSLEASFTPTSTRYDTSWAGVRVVVAKARPSVRLSMDHRWYRVKADLGRDEPGTVRVSTAGMPERGRLVLETRSPRADVWGWRTRWATDWALQTSEQGVQRVKVPATYLRTADGKPGKVYLRFRYVPSDAAHVATVVSPEVTIVRY
ncbi:Ig-like domain-containing protein [Isoptericola sp. NPDC057191]|uniref:Ig-like domain-containing protein n=1 Tax=Isoptericola sp. NPDC057191 TaxID=3346041 RepID=UPI00363C269D